MASGVFKNLSGQVFDRLTVVRRIENVHNKVMYECACVCGNFKNIRSDALINRTTRSCGCLQKEKASISGKLSKKPDSQSMKNDLFSNYKRRARLKKIEFSLSFDTFCKMISLECFYCGEFEHNRYKDPYNSEILRYNGIDRLNSNIGYIDNNTVTCCGQCNYMKLDYSKDEFLNKVAKIYRNKINEHV